MHNKLLRFSLLSVVLPLMVACGSSSNNDDEGSSLVSRGIITGFGSVFVNGIRFGTSGTDFTVDDDDGDESDLRVGMFVTVKGSSSGGNKWHADEIDYDNELKGPVTEILVDPADTTRKTLTLLGQSVVVDANTTIDDDGGLTFDTIALGDVLEVSGFITDSGLLATHIELQDNDDEIEIRGRIKNLTAISFDINGFPVSYDDNTQLDDISVLSEDLLVEVEGRLNAAGTILIAAEIEAEDDNFGDDADEVEIEGVISEFNPDDTSFVIQGQFVDASNAQLFPASLVLANDLIVEVEGHIEGDVLIAREIKQKGKKIKIHSTLSAVSTDDSTISFSFNETEIVVRVHSQTELEDDINGTDITLFDLSKGDFVEMEAFEDGSGSINAVEVERENPDGIRVVAPVDDFDPMGLSVTLLGVTFDLSAATFEDADDNVIDADKFFMALDVGVFVKIKDDDSDDVFEEAELED